MSPISACTLSASNRSIRFLYRKSPEEPAMADALTVDAGARYAFAPSPEPIEGAMYRIRTVFQAFDGRVWSSGTDMFVPTMDSAADFCDALNTRLCFDHDGWTAFAERVFAALPTE